MIRSRLGLKALGLCAMLVGMFAFTGVAQAEPEAFWLVKGEKFSSGLLPAVQAETDTPGSLLTILGGKEIHLRCPNIKLVGAHLVEPLGQILGKIHFSGCKFFALIEGKEVEQKACAPFVGANKELIETNTITGLIKLHEGEATILATPPAGGFFATINLGEECAFGEFLKVGNGEDKVTKKVLEAEFSLKDCKKAALTDLVKHLVEELPALTKLYVNGGETKATVHGSAWAFLIGAHESMTFAAHPDKKV